MEVSFRLARRDDVPAIVALLTDDVLGRGRERDDLSVYQAAFDAIAEESGNSVIVGEAGGRVIATYQITLISNLSLGANRRAQIEAVRVADDFRGQGVGALLFADAEARARAGGATLMQLTSNASRERSHGFYLGLGFVASHVGFKKPL